MKNVKHTLGRLERAELRQIWQTEAEEFTPWLATEENLRLLGDTLGLELELEGQEKSVGPFPPCDRQNRVPVGSHRFFLGFHRKKLREPRVARRANH